jgi:hypothetical protein
MEETTTENERKDDRLTTSVKDTKLAQLKRQCVPSDNSCLFSALNFIINNGNFDVENPKDRNQVLRDSIACKIESQPDKYTEVILEMSPAAYVLQIRQPTTWGGDIDIRVFEMIHQIEVRNIDLVTRKVVQQSPEDAVHCSYIIWHGQHYEPLYRFNPVTEKIQTQFVMDDDLSDADLKTIEEWSQECMLKKKSHDAILYSQKYVEIFSSDYFIVL